MFKSFMAWFSEPERYEHATDRYVSLYNAALHDWPEVRLHLLPSHPPFAALRSCPAARQAYEDKLGVGGTFRQHVRVSGVQGQSLSTECVRIAKERTRSALCPLPAPCYAGSCAQKGRAHARAW